LSARLPARLPANLPARLPARLSDFLPAFACRLHPPCLPTCLNLLATLRLASAFTTHCLSSFWVLVNVCSALAVRCLLIWLLIHYLLLHASVCCDVHEQMQAEYSWREVQIMRYLFIK
jgi:hypothetical protein